MKVRIGDDFDLDKIVRSGQCFRPVKLDGSTYRFVTGEHVLHIRQVSPKTYEVDCTRWFWSRVWKRYFDLGRSYSEIRSAIASEDDFMYRAAAYGAGVRVLRQDPWETLVSFIASQRKSIPAIRSCIESVAAAWGREVSTVYGQVRLFPSALQMADASQSDLRACGLGYRAAYVADAVSQVASGRVDLGRIGDLSDAELLDALMSISGVGVKVAHCVALFAYGRVGLAPVDTWIAKISDRKYQGRDPFAAYGGVAGIVQQYAFLYALDHKHEF